MARTFDYKVRDLRGRFHRGKLEAEDRQSVLRKLQESGFLVIQLKEKKTVNFLSRLQDQIQTVKTKDLAVFSLQLSAMLRAGIPIVNCLETLTQQTSNNHLRIIINDVKRDVHQGESLHQALAKHREFPKFYIQMVKAGETGGMLDDSLKMLSQHYEREHEVMQKVRSATAYPLFVTVMAILTISGLITFILPTFTKPYKDSGVPLPWPTQFLLGVSQFFTDYFVHLFLGLVLLVMAGYLYFRTDKGRLTIDSFLLRLPLIREIITKLATYRLSRMLAGLNRSGIPILAAMEAVAQVIGNEAIAKAILQARDCIKGGDGIARPLASLNLFPPMVTQMIAVGEETGRMDEMLYEISQYSEGEIDYMVDNITKMLEPVLIVFVALLVGFIILSIMLPMYGSMRLR